MLYLGFVRVDLLYNPIIKFVTKNVTVTVICNRFCYCRGPWNGVYTARDSPGQPHMIVVIDKKLLKFERGHRATR